MTAPEAGMGAAAAPDLGQLAAMALRVWGYKQGEVVSLMIHLGDRLGLYQALREAGPVTAGELAARTGLHPRWLLEWLRCQAAAGLIGSADGEVFHLSPAAAALLADEDTSVWFAAGAFQGAAATAETVDRVAGSFRTGGGLSFDELGPDAAARVERTLGPWSRLGAGAGHPARPRRRHRAAAGRCPHCRRGLRERHHLAHSGRRVSPFPFRGV